MDECGGRIKRQKISDHTQKMLFVEGNDEIIFFNRIFDRVLERTDIQVYQTGGKDQFSKELPAVMAQRNFENIERIGIVQDSDENTQAAFNRICNTLKQNGLIAPESLNTFTDANPSIGVFLMPNNADKGMLETLCLRSVEGEIVFDCINKFFSCLKEKEIEINNIHKAKAQVYLATRKKLIKHVGRGAEKNVWDFDAKCMEGLKEFLLNI